MDQFKFAQPEVEWAENVILADADYLDSLVFDVSVQLERMLERRLPKLDLARWADYVALDGGLRPGDNAVQLLLIHSKKKGILKNILPANLATEIDGQAFRDNLGEFSLSAFPVEDTMVTPGQLFTRPTESRSQCSACIRRAVCAARRSRFPIPCWRLLASAATR